MIAEIDISNRMKFVYGTGITEGKALAKLLFYNKRNTLIVEENEYRTEEIQGSRGVFGEQECILIADVLTLSDVTSFSKHINKIKGVVYCSNDLPNYLYAYARSNDIPLLVISEEISFEHEKSEALLDAERDILIIAPDIIETDLFVKAVSQATENHTEKKNTDEENSETQHYASVYEDLVFLEQLTSIEDKKVNGFAFLHSEFFTLGQPLTQAEEKLFEIYKKAVLSSKGREIMISTVCVKRGIDVGEREVDIIALLKKQVRALCRASYFGNLTIIFPTIANCEELSHYLKIYIDIKNELRYENVPFCEDILIGITIQTPAALMSSTAFIQQVQLIIVNSDELYRYSYGDDFNYRLMRQGDKDTAEPLLRMLCIADEAVHAKGGRIGLDGCLAKRAISDNKQYYICSDVLFVPPSEISKTY